MVVVGVAIVVSDAVGVVVVVVIGGHCPSVSAQNSGFSQQTQFANGQHHSSTE